MVLIQEESDVPPSTWNWALHIIFPNVLTCSQGFTVLLISIGIIQWSSNLLDLIKDLTSLMIVSELDNMVFDFTAYGYLGRSLYLKTLDAQDIEIDDNAQERQQGCISFMF